jgi:hypothetical protein
VADGFRWLEHVEQEVAPSLDRYDSEGQATVVDMLLRPARYYQRIVETCEAKVGALSRHVSMEIKVAPPATGSTTGATLDMTDTRRTSSTSSTRSPRPSSVIVSETEHLEIARGVGATGTHRSSMLALPLIRARRETLLDNLDVFDASGRSLGVLSHDEHQGFASVLLLSHALALLCLDGPTSEATETTRQVLDRLCSIPFLCTDDARTEIVEIFSRIRQKVEQGGASSDPLLRLLDSSSMYQLCRLLAEYYLVLIEVPRDETGRVLVKYSYDSQFLENTNENAIERFRGWLVTGRIVSELMPASWSNATAITYGCRARTTTTSIDRTSLHP